MSIYRFVASFTQHDPRSNGYAADARALGFDNLRIKCMDLYFIEGQLSEVECEQLALELLIDPVTQTVEWCVLGENPSEQDGQGEVTVEIALRPGVTDPVAEQLVRAAHELGYKNIQRASTGLRFRISGLEPMNVEKLVKRLLVNNTIQVWSQGQIRPSFPQQAASSGLVETLSICSASPDELLALSKDRRAALDLAEMQAIQAYFQKEGREPTDVEFEMIAQTWSEHCVHKTFKARVDLFEVDASGRKTSAGSINSLIKTYLKAATDKINVPWVISAFVDNAGIIEFDDDNEVSFKVETHNHPSAIEPFGGANTGVGGVIRDVIGVSAKPIANTDVLCFGSQDANPDKLPEGVLHPRRIQSGVIAGVQDYGNKIGIPTVNGAILYDDGFTANPLVFCGCVGLAPRGRHTKSPRKDDRIIILGGRTGRDGLRGATFSSMTMDAQTGEVSGASVQIGDPITEKGLIDVILRARDAGIYTDITDCGAGGLSSAVGEMTSGLGGTVDLDSVRLKYTGLAPWEIWLSEAQERMVLAVPLDKVSALQELCDTFDTELTDIGAFDGSEHIRVYHAGQVVLDLKNDFLHEGLPQRRLEAVIQKASFAGSLTGKAELPAVEYLPCLLSLLSHPNISSKEATIRLYDHEVQGGTVVKLLTGVFNEGPTDGAVLKPAGTAGVKGIVLSNGINAEYGKIDAYGMARAVIDEAVRNAVAAGADPSRIAILDNFCWGDPLKPEMMGTLVEALRGCHDAALAFGTPFISGKDSLNNEYMGADGLRHSIPPTLLISAIGLIEDVNFAMTSDLKKASDRVYLVGDFGGSFGGSHYSLAGFGEPEISREPLPSVSELTPRVNSALHTAIRQGIVAAAHDLSEGGLLVCAAEMCIGGRLGLDLSVDSQEPARSLFAETTGCYLVEVPLAQSGSFEGIFTGLPFREVGTVTKKAVLRVSASKQLIFSAQVESLAKSWGAGA